MRFIQSIVFVLFLGVCSSAVAQSISGLASVTYSTQTTYSFQADFDLFSPQWAVTNGTIISSNFNPSLYYTEVTVHWNSGAGTGTVTLNDGYQLDSKQVTIRPLSPTTTNASRCGTGTVNLSATPGSGANSIRWYTASSGGSLLNTGTTYAPNISSSTTYYIVSYSTSGNIESTPRVAVTATVNAVPSAPSVSGNSRWGTGLLTLTGSGAPGGGNYKWYNPSNVLLHTGASYQTPSLSSSQSNYVYVRAVNASGCESAQVWVNVVVTSLPVVNAPSTRFVIGGPEKILLDAGAGYSTYQWKNKSGTLIGSNQTYEAGQSGEYTVTVTKSGTTGTATSTPFRLYSQLEGQDMNYTVVHAVLAEGVKDQASIKALSVDSVSQTIQYFDGLGRLLQTVITQGSPDKKDMVQPVAYDALGREAIKYLPYISTSIDGNFRSAALNNGSGYSSSEQYGFYQTLAQLTPEDERPFSEVIFETSPLGRPAKEYGPGQDWRDNNRFVKFDYLTNVHGTSSGQEKIIIWEVSNGLPVRYATLNSGYYPSHSLQVKVSTDEQGNQVRDYTNKEGKMILRKVQAVTGTVNVNNDSQWAQTYYIYDYKGQLRLVLQPELVKSLVVSNNNPTTTELGHFAFQYKYDKRGRQVELQMPGAGVVYKVYDKRDRLVLTQDALQRSENQWMFTKYDQLNRPVMTGIYTHSDSVSREYMVGLISTSQFAEQYDKTKAHGYTTGIFPNTNLTVHTVTFYDNYAFRDDALTGAGFEFKGDHLSGQDTEYFDRITGLVAGIKVNILGTNDYLWAVNYYDDRYRVIQAVTQNHKDSLDRVTNIYDFTGNVLQTRTTHSTASETHTVTRRLEYDHAGRPLRTWHKVNTEDEALLNENEYNPLGELVVKKLHSKDNGNTFKQHIDYRYNIRGWTTRINHANLNTTDGGPKDFFGMELAYNTVFSGINNTPQFNGNISATKWSANLGLGIAQLDQPTERAYTFEYDPMNRLLSAAHREKLAGWNVSNAFFEGNLVYDLNGNIEKLSRRANDGLLMDSLIYTYTGNQLMKVDDKGDITKGFKDGNIGSNDYAYDPNGSMTKDLNKDITMISYNYLNLPQKGVKSNGDSIRFIYDATGHKLAQIEYGTTQKRLDYLGEFLYENDTLQSILHEEGRIVPEGNSYPYEYHLKDHLGNVRATFTTKEETETYTAGFETADAATEEAEFSPSYDNAVIINSSLYNHTPGGSKSQRLSAANQNEIIGLAKSLKVVPGDTIEIEVYAKYYTPTVNNTNVGSLILASISSAFGVNSSSTGEAGLLYESLEALNNFGLLINSGEEVDEDAPKAFLNYILFDDDFVPYDFGFEQVSTSALETGSGVPHEKLELQAVARKSGYIYIYLSNESNKITDVYFDDLRITYKRSPVLEETMYYPFGLVADNYKRQSMTNQPFKYNGKEEVAFGGWNDFGARMYMSDIGRWGIVDPLAEKMRRWSTYNYAFNNPLRYIDPDGMSPVMASDLNFSRTDLFDYTRSDYNLYERTFFELSQDKDPFAFLRSDNYGSNEKENKGEKVSDDEQPQTQKGNLNALAAQFLPDGLDLAKLSANTTWVLDPDEKETNPNKPLKIPALYPDGETDPKAQLMVYVHPSVLKADSFTKKHLFGHEWIHVYDSRSGNFRNWVREHTLWGAKNILEYRAYDWGLSQPGINNSMLKYSLTGGRNDAMFNLIKLNIDYTKYRY